MAESPKDKGPFDHLADGVSRQTSRAWFFVAILVGEILWLTWGPKMGWGNNTWHLILNSPTTAITCLLVALDANLARRRDTTQDHKSNAMAKALVDIMEHLGKDCAEHEGCGFVQDRKDLIDAIGLEDEVGTKRR